MSMVIPERTERKYKPYLEYKYSGVEWLGEIPTHWEVKKLKYVAEIITGNTPPKSDPENYDELEGLPWIKPDNLRTFLLASESQEYLSAKGAALAIVVPKEAVLTCCIGSIGSIGIAGCELATNQQINSVVFSGQRVHRKYGFYMVYASLPEYRKLANLNVVAIINSQSQKTIPIPLPSLPEQQAIADFLDSETARIDELIARKQRLIDLLQEQRTALITRAVTKGLNPDAPMKDSGVEWIGEIPAHWEIKRLKYVTANNPGAIKSGPFGSQILTSEMSGSDVKVYNQRNVVDQDFDSGENYITQAKYLELSSFTVYAGDILITTRGTIGRCAIVPQQAPLGILHPCLMRIQPDIKKALSNYLKIIIQDSALFYAQLQYFSNATTIDVVYTDTLKNTKIPLPPPTEQQAIVDFLEQETARIDNLIGRIKQAIEKLQEYRSALITAAVTGIIDVRQYAS